MTKNKNIVLIGLMGAGKTTVGKVISNITGYQFTDIDEIIETRENEKISKIFETKGEKHFRTLEINTIKEFSAKGNLVISTGGGAPENPVNLENLKGNGTLFYLYATVDELYKRLLTEIANRPMLHTENPKEKLAILLDRREPFYLQSHYKIETTNKSPEEIADKIIQLFNRSNNDI